MFKFALILLFIYVTNASAQKARPLASLSVFEVDEVGRFCMNLDDTKFFLKSKNNEVDRAKIDLANIKKEESESRQKVISSCRNECFRVLSNSDSKCKLSKDAIVKLVTPADLKANKLVVGDEDVAIYVGERKLAKKVKESDACEKLFSQMSPAIETRVNGCTQEILDGALQGCSDGVTEAWVETYGLYSRDLQKSMLTAYPVKDEQSECTLRDPRQIDHLNEMMDARISNSCIDSLLNSCTQLQAAIAKLPVRRVASESKVKANVEPPANAKTKKLECEACSVIMGGPDDDSQNQKN